MKPWLLLNLLIVMDAISGFSSHSLRHHQRDSVPDDSDFSSSAEKSQSRVEITVRLHQEVQLHCNLYKSSRFKYKRRWRHNDQLIADDVTQRYTRDPANGQLYIANVKVQDSGLWYCEELDVDTGTVIAVGQKIRLIVTEPPNAPFLEVDGRRLDPGTMFLSVAENRTLRVRCVVEGGHPTPEVTWELSLNHSSLSIDSGQDGFLQVYSDVSFPKVLRVHHNATITCLVQHVTLSEPLSASLRLDVQYAPSFIISREPGFGFPLVEGIPVSLRCEADSNPPSSTMWVRDDGLVSVPETVDGFLNFSSIGREHSGWYKCMCSGHSSLGYFLNVRYEDDATPGPEVTSTGQDVEVTVGDVVRIHCPTNGAPCWKRASTGRSLEAAGLAPQLNLQRVFNQATGSNRCVNTAPSTLDEWKSSLSVDSSETGAPIVYPSNRTLTAITGQELALTVDFCANPAINRAIWLTDRVLLRPGDSTASFIARKVRAGNSPYCRQATLTLRSVRPGDAGEYAFMVRSPKGLAEGNFVVNVIRTSEFPVTTAASHHLLPVGMLYLFAEFSLLAVNRA